MRIKNLPDFMHLHQQQNAGEHMKNLVAVLVAAFFSLVIGQANAATLPNPQSSIKSLDHALLCAKEKDKPKKKTSVEDEEPDCD
jgi:hypothetical protein